MALTLAFNVPQQNQQDDGSDAVETGSSRPWDSSSSKDSSSESCVNLDENPKPAVWSKVDRSFLCQILSLQHTQLEVLRNVRNSIGKLEHEVAKVQGMVFANSVARASASTESTKKKKRSKKRTMPMPTIALSFTRQPCRARGLNVLRKVKVSNCNRKK